jgi:hypothetical protein
MAWTVLYRTRLSTGPALGRGQPPGGGWNFLHLYRAKTRGGSRKPFPARTEPAQPARTALEQEPPEVSPHDEYQTAGGLIVAKCELGTGHAVFVRGEGGGLSWHQGERLFCIEPGVWAWFSARVGNRVSFQLLLDDLIWARGKQLTLQPGQRLDVTPDFEWPEIPRTPAG